MQSIDRDRRYRFAEAIVWIGFFAAAFFLCGLISYTDGDDAYFSGMAKSMGFFDYIKMRYIGWEGRVTSEAMTYLAFYFGIKFWQLANAVILTMLPFGLVKAVKRMTGEMTAEQNLCLAAASCLGILLLGIEVVGYGAFWVTGSTFYLWSITAGIWAVQPFIDLAFQKRALSWKTFLYALPCGFIAAMGQEQIAAVVIAFGCLSLIYAFYREKKINWLPLAELLVMTAALTVLFLSPGTDARSQSEIQTWMPQYDTMPVGNHIFITLQWLLSGFANEGRMLFVMIWVLSIFLLLKKGGKMEKGLAASAAVFTIAALLPFAGIHWFSEMGTGVEDITVIVTETASPSSISLQNWFAMVWWTFAILFTLALLWNVGKDRLEKMTAVLMILASAASAAIMYFSPTMYASGGRVLFVGEILLWLVALLLFRKLWKRGQQIMLCIFSAGGILNFAVGFSYVMTFL